jgi:hypothetical protein
MGWGAADPPRFRKSNAVAVLQFQYYSAGDRQIPVLRPIAGGFRAAFASLETFASQAE